MGFAEAAAGTPEIDSGLPRGTMYHAAVMAWFQADGKLRPMSFKFQGDDGEILTVRDILINYEEDKDYAGIPSREYGCQAVVGGLIRDFRLVFYCEACKWVMLI